MQPLTDEEERAIELEAWTEYRWRVDCIQHCVLGWAFVVLAAVCCVCLTEAVITSNGSSYGVGAVVSGMLALAVACVWGAAFVWRVEEDFDRKAILLAIMGKKEAWLREKNNGEMV